MNKKIQRKKPLIIVGDSAFAEIAFEYFSSDKRFNVKCFSIEKAFIKNPIKLGLPVVPFEEIEKTYNPNDHSLFVAVAYSQLNSLRTRLLNEAEQKGYTLASYVSPKAFIWKNVQIGKHCFIFENNIIQPFVKIQDNVILWSGNHIGHHTKINDNCFISSHVVISGFCNIGENSFIGVNAAVSNSVTLGKNNWIGPSSLITKNTKDNTIFTAKKAEASKVSALEFFKI